VWSSSDYSLDKSAATTSEEESFIETWNKATSETKFEAKNLLKQLATGTGLGLRYDLDFLVVRIDWGFGLHVPYETSKGGYFNIPRFKDMHSLHFAIGYPF
jgi:hypothetical protein